MKTITFFAAALLACSNTVHAQQHTDTMLSVTLKNTDIVSDRVMNHEQLYEYSRLWHNVTVVLPYVNKITAMYQDAAARFGNKGENVKEKRRYMNGQEEALRREYKDKLKNLTIEQGRLLNQLISRQTGTTTYNLLKEYENGFTAFKWNALGSFYNYELKKMYDPSENRMLETVMKKMGYPLPSFFITDTTGNDSM